MSEKLEINGQVVELDEDGFLVNPEDWSEEAAVALAKMEEVEELTEEHWAIIKYLQEYFKQFGIAPMVRKMTKDTGMPLKKIYELFPTGPAKGACKVAGLPKPTGCV